MSDYKEDLRMFSLFLLLESLIGLST